MAKYSVAIKHDSQKLPDVLVWFYFLIRLIILLSGLNHIQQHGFYQKLAPKGRDKPIVDSSLVSVRRSLVKEEQHTWTKVIQRLHFIHLSRVPTDGLEKKLKPV